MHTTSRIALACASILALTTFPVMSAAAQPPETVVEPDEHEGHLVEADVVSDDAQPDQAAPPAHDHGAAHAAHAAHATGAGPAGGAGGAGGGSAAAGGNSGGGAPVATAATATTAEPTPETAPLGSSGVGGTGGNGRPVQDPDNPH